MTEIKRINWDRNTNSSLSLRDFLILVFKRKIIFVLTFCSVVSVVVILTLLTKPTYLASGKILVKTDRETVNILTHPNKLPGEMEINSEIEILNSRSLAEKTIIALGPEVIYPKPDFQDQGLRYVLQKYIREKKDDLKSLVVKFLPQRRESTPPENNQDAEVLAVLARFQEALSIKPIEDTNLIQVEFRHSNPQAAAMVVNTLADIYLDHHLAVYKTPRFNEFIEQQTQFLKKKLQESEKKFELLRAQHKIVSLDQERTLLLREETDLRAELNRTRSLEVETQKRINQIQQQLQVTPKTIQEREAVNQNQGLLSNIEIKLVELELREMELRRKYTDEMPEVQSVKEEIRVVREKLAEEEKRSYVTKGSGLNPNYQKIQAELMQYESDLKAFKAKMEILEVQLGDLQRKLKGLNQIEMELDQVQQEIDVDRQNYKLYLSKYEEIKISEAMDSEKITRISVIEPARPPLYSKKSSSSRNFVLSIFLGLFAALGITFLLHYLDDSLETVEDVEQFLELPVLGSIAELKR